MGKRKLTQEEVIGRMKELQPDYNFDHFIYKNCFNKSIVICNHNHEYIVNYHNFHSGYRCPFCAGKKHYINPIQKMKEVAPEYDFSKFKYKKSKIKSIVICPNNHQYEVSYDNFMNNRRRCPHCSKRKSKPEFEIIDFIKTFYNGTIEQSNRKIIKNPKTNRHLELDIYLPDLKMAIEFNGIYWHSDEMAQRKGFNSIQEKHDLKTNLCSDKDIYLIHIEEQQWLSNKDKILQLIKEQILKRIT